MARTTVKELENRINTMENKLDKLIDLFSNSSNGATAKAPKNSGTVKGSKKTATKSATKVEITVVDGTGKGEGKKFINLVFDGKPSDKVRETMKANGFHYFAKNSVWSASHTDKHMKVAQSLIK